MREETLKYNRQIAAWGSHDLTRNNELAVSSSKNLHVYHYQMLNVFFFLFQLMYQQIVDMNYILWESNVKAIRQDQT